MVNNETGSKKEQLSNQIGVRLTDSETQKILLATILFGLKNRRPIATSLFIRSAAVEKADRIIEEAPKEIIEYIELDDETGGTNA